MQVDESKPFTLVDCKLVEFFDAYGPVAFMSEESKLALLVRLVGCGLVRLGDD